jgi:WD40 repeat protein
MRCYKHSRAIIVRSPQSPSLDSKQIVSRSRDTTVRRWDAATGQQLLPALEGHTGRVTSVASFPDGKQIATSYVSENWLAEGITILLWLPPGYRPTCEATWGGVIALRHQSGGVSILHFQLGPKLVTRKVVLINTVNDI